MKNLIHSHKTPKFADELVSKTTLRPRSSTPITSEPIKKPLKTKKTNENSTSYEYHIENIAKEKQKIEKLLKNNNKLPLKELNPQISNSNEFIDICNNQSNLQQNSLKSLESLKQDHSKNKIKEKIDFINQMFDNIQSQKNISQENSLENNEEDNELPEKPKNPEKFEKKLEFTQKKYKSQNDKNSIEEKNSISNNLGRKLSSKNEISFVLKNKNNCINDSEKNLLRKKYEKTEKIIQKTENNSKSPLKKTIMKNFIEANKRNNGLGKKLYQTYEKVLKSFDNDIERNKEKSKLLKSPLKSPNKSPLKSSTLQNYKKPEIKQKNRNSNKSLHEKEEIPDFKKFYDEMANLAKNLNKTALIMNQTFLKMENMKKTPKKKIKESSESDNSDD